MADLYSTESYVEQDLIFQEKPAEQVHDPYPEHRDTAVSLAHNSAQNLWTQQSQEGLWLALLLLLICQHC